MRSIILMSLALLVVGCTPKAVIKENPLGYSFMPKYVDLDSIGPQVTDDTNKVVDKTFRDYKSLMLDTGKLVTIYKDTLLIPQGVLFSERKAALYTFYKASWERQQTQLKYTNYMLRQYYDKALAAETLYQAEISRLQNASKRTWLEKNAPYIGFFAGIATVILELYAAGQLFGD